MPFLLLIAFWLLGSGTVCADPPKLLTRAEIEKIIRENAPIPALGIELFEILVGPSTTPQSPPASTGLLALRPSSATALAVQSRLGAIGSTGDTATDEAVAKARAATLQIAVQAALHFKFQTAIVPPESGSDYKVVIEMLRAVVGKGADGVFDSLNQQFLFSWGKLQYEKQLESELRALLARGLLSANADARLRTLHAGLRLVPVQTRAEFWTLGLTGEDDKKKAARMREFLGSQNTVHTQVYGEHLPRYLALAEREQRAGVLRLISGHQLRDPKIVASVLNWKLSKVKSVEELADALWMELNDAAFSRFNASGKLKEPETNPLEVHRNTSSAAAPDAEEELFTDVFTAALQIAEGLLDKKTAALFDLLYARFAESSRQGNYAFVVETFLFHLEKKFNEDGNGGALTIKYSPAFLTRLELFLGPTTDVVKKRAWRDPLHAHTRYVLEEAILRRLGWFPPTVEVLGQAMALLRGELEGGTGPLSHEGRAAFRLVTETPPMFFGEVVGGIMDNPRTVLAQPGFAVQYEGCIKEIVKLYEKLPPPQE